MQPIVFFASRTIFALALALAANCASAQVFKCKGADGKLQFSDKPCTGAASAEVVPDRWGSVSAEDRRAAQQRAARLQQNADAIDAERAARHQSAVSMPSPQPAAPAAPNLMTQAENAKDCMRSVERQALTIAQREQMAAACAAAPMPANAAEKSLIDNCRREVDRQALSGEEKARRMAQCSGASVPVATQPAKKPYMPMAGGLVGSVHCNAAGCSDDAGNFYRKKANGDYVGPNGRCHNRNGYMYCD